MFYEYIGELSTVKGKSTHNTKPLLIEQNDNQKCYCLIKAWIAFPQNSRFNKSHVCVLQVQVTKNVDMERCTNVSYTLNANVWSNWALFCMPKHTIVNNQSIKLHFRFYVHAGIQCVILYLRYMVYCCIVGETI